MTDHFQLSDAEFEEQFAAGAFPPKLFTHEAHLRLAWIHLRKYGLEQAIRNVTDQLQQFVQMVGAEGKFHMTLSVAAVKAVYHFMGRATSPDFRGLLEEFPALRDQFRELIDAHYGADRLNSPAARSTFLEPDRLPFP